MLTSEFEQEMGALVRSLGNRARMEPSLQYGELEDAKATIERAIVTLCALHISLQRQAR